MLSKQTQERNEKIREVTGKHERLVAKGRKLKEEYNELTSKANEKAKEIEVNEHEIQQARKEAEEVMN